MKKKENHHSLPNFPENQCFGCSAQNEFGLQMKFEAKEESVISKLVVPKHLCGWKKLVHGGVTSTILDEIMSWSVIYTQKSFVMTKSMTVDFLNPMNVNEEIIAEGKVIEVVGKHDVIAEGYIYNIKGKLCAKSRGNFALLSPKVAKRMGLVDDANYPWFETDQ